MLPVMVMLGSILMASFPKFAAGTARSLAPRAGRGLG
jgi:hypothetical protein